MKKSEILCYWGARVSAILEFYEGCNYKHRALLSAKIGRRLKKHRKELTHGKCFGKHKGQIDMFPPTEKEIIQLVKQRAQEAENHIKSQGERLKHCFFLLSALLEDGEDYDFETLIFRNMDIAFFLERAQKHRRNLHAKNDREIPNSLSDRLNAGHSDHICH